MVGTAAVTGSSADLLAITVLSIFTGLVGAAMIPAVYFRDAGRRADARLVLGQILDAVMGRLSLQQDQAGREEPTDVA